MVAEAGADPPGGLGRRQTGRLADPAGGQGLCPLLPRRHAGSAKSGPGVLRHLQRLLRAPAARRRAPIVADANWLALPADGAISQLGPIRDDQIFQAKGHYYSLEALLAGNYLLAEPFRNGLFATTYLAPRDYHRVHMPCAGVLREMIYVPGDLFSVNPLTAANVPNLFARNERVICVFDTDIGPMVQILVGATIVGSIETVWAGTVTPPREGIIKRWTYPAAGEEGAIALEKAPRWAASNSAPR